MNTCHKTIPEILADGVNIGVFQYVARTGKGNVNLGERFNQPPDFDSMLHHGFFDLGNSRSNQPFVFATEKGIKMIIVHTKESSLPFTENDLPETDKRNYRKWKREQ